MSNAHLPTGPVTIRAKLQAMQLQPLALLVTAILLIAGTAPSFAASPTKTRLSEAKSLETALKPAANPQNAASQLQYPAGRIVMLNSRTIDLTALPETAFGDQD